MKRGGISASRVPTIDVFWSKQLLNPGKVAFLGSIQESRITSKQVQNVLVTLFNQIHGGVSVSVLFGGICPVLEQKFDCKVDEELVQLKGLFKFRSLYLLTNFIFAFGRALMERSESPQITNVDRGPMLD